MPKLNKTNPVFEAFVEAWRALKIGDLFWLYRPSGEGPVDETSVVLKRDIPPYTKGSESEFYFRETSTDSDPVWAPASIYASDHVIRPIPPGEWDWAAWDAKIAAEQAKAEAEAEAEFHAQQLRFHAFVGKTVGSVEQDDSTYHGVKITFTDGTWVFINGEDGVKVQVGGLTAEQPKKDEPKEKMWCPQCDGCELDPQPDGSVWCNAPYQPAGCGWRGQPEQALGKK